MRAQRALDPGLLADALDPFVRAGWGIAGLAGLPALEPPRVDVLAAAEQRAEEGNLGRCRRMLAECLSAGSGNDVCGWLLDMDTQPATTLPGGLRRAF